MKLLVLSDLHLEFAQFRVPDVDYDVVILAGDISVPASKVRFWACRAKNFGEAKPIIFVPGNHEFYAGVMSSTLTAMRQASAGTNFHALDCRQVVVDGVRFLGCTLWTDFAVRIDTPEGLQSDAVAAAFEAGQVLADFRAIRVAETIAPAKPGAQAQNIRRQFTPEDSLALHQQHREWLLEKLKEPFDGATVVITHHAPHRGSLAAQYANDWVSGAFVSELPSEFFEVPVLWVHGHTHTSFDYRVNQCRVVCNPRGYMLGWNGRIPENDQFDPAFIVDLPRQQQPSQAH